jgi:hypothetical protein
VPNTHPPILLPSELLNPESTSPNSTLQYHQVGYQLSNIIEVQFTGTGTTVSKDRVGYARHTYTAMHDIGARGPQPAAEPRPAAARFLCLGRPRPGRNFFVVAAEGCGPFVPAFVA